MWATAGSVEAAEADFEGESGVSGEKDDIDDDERKYLRVLADAVEAAEADFEGGGRNYGEKGENDDAAIN